MGCKVHFRNIISPRFTTGGGLVRWNMTIDRCSGIVQVWPSRRRKRAELDLPTFVRLVEDRWAMAEARAQQAEKKRRRLVKRGLLGCAVGG